MHNAWHWQCGLLLSRKCTLNNDDKLTMKSSVVLLYLTRLLLKVVHNHIGSKGNHGYAKAREHAGEHGPI